MRPAATRSAPPPSELVDLVKALARAHADEDNAKLAGGHGAPSRHEHGGPLG